MKATKEHTILRSATAFFETIKVSHTVFALPFAYMTLFLVSWGWPTWDHFFWITVAMVGARTFGMAANRLVDARIDAANPRTATRAIPAGRLTPAAALAFMLVAITVFLAAVWQLHPVCRKLWPVVIVAMTVYPYGKRFTWAAHLLLGFVYFLIPTAIWFAVTGHLTRDAVILGIGAGFWVAGFDIIYACLDAEHDAEHGLHSIPANFGIDRALVISEVLHFVFAAAMLYVGASLGMGRLYYIGVVLMTALLLYEHHIVSPRDLSRVNAAFFTANGLASIVLFVLVALDLVL